ncbi:MAG: phosphatidylglycerol lysyltransferase [Spirochaetales bacterium]|nr:phosphatidylglycerol lysyltransferase [Spirochaetales bacterium]
MVKDDKSNCYSEMDPLENIILSENDKAKCLETSILSASGWRRVFAHDNNEENNTDKINDAGKFFVAAAGLSFADFIKQIYHKPQISILVATDARPTGSAIAEIIIRVLLGTGINVKYTAVTAAPEVYCTAAIDPTIDGFVYISASHNPVGHNGFKFGLDNGGVIGGADATTLINIFKEKYNAPNTLTLVQQISNSINLERIKQLFSLVKSNKKNSEKIYFDFTKEVITAKKSTDDQDKLLDQIASAAKISPIGVVAEYNGSARGVTIDKDFLEKLNIKVKTLNSKPGEIVHRIVPEGKSLDLCRSELEKAYVKDNAYILGFVPDNDGDRGNVVYIDTTTKKAEIIEAQEIFALCCAVEMSYLEYCGELTFDRDGRPEVRAAIVVNDPTSNRIEEIAGAFGAKVLRAEVGEANVVNLAEETRNKGVIVRILGEGSNGGNITFPSAVRDPLDTIGALLKLMVLKSTPETKGLFEIWCSRSNQMDLYKEDFSIKNMLATLPKYITTSAYENDAKVDIKTMDHAKLKAAYEEVFLEEWEEEKAKLRKKYNFYTYKVINYEGIHEKHGMGSQYRSGLERGGFKILFRDENGEFKAYMWMRGSGTEPVFRVMVDFKTTNIEDEKAILKWHTKLVKKADKLAQTR